MATLSGNQIAQYAAGAGFSGQALNIAVAVALAESSGRTDAINYNTDGSTDYGLWQINSVHKQFNPRMLFDPAYNARAAYAVSSNGTNWIPWTTFKSGAYKKHLGNYSGGTMGNPVGQLATVNAIFDSKRLWKWWTQNNGRGTNVFDGVSEKGIDYSAAFGTPIGVPVGGVVVRIKHFTSSVGDVVEIKDGNGAVWLYQHITSHVRVGQALSTGDVVGTENGLPVDQYSTGPHIEVRYCPPGKWSPTKDSWVEPWVNPYNVFVSIGGQPATGPSGVTSYSDTGTGGGGSSGPTYVPLLQQVHETLTAHPGMYGIALSVDEASQYPGWIDLTDPQHVDVGGVWGFDMPDFNGIVRSIGATATDNFVPFCINGGLVLIGFILIVALLLKAIGKPAAQLLPLLA